MATSVTSAINLETGEEEHVRNAKDGQLHKCKFCPAHMLPVQGAIREWHYRLAPGHQHTHPICMQLEKHGRAYDVQQTDLEKLFAGLYRPDKEPTTPPPSPGPEPEPEPGPEDPGDDGGEETGGEEEPEIYKVLPPAVRKNPRSIKFFLAGLCTIFGRRESIIFWRMLKSEMRCGQIFFSGLRISTS